ncbi:putative entry exclusion protein TrbK-alt [Bradyrhizobium sp.]|uniref:putative entry exclusion protein TrbK-alt n=1 Tax=Bradyrhizobium sp. TaxID=376 RepID=UPI00345C8463
MVMREFKWLRLVATAGVALAVLTACEIRLRGGPDGLVQPAASRKSDALDMKLTRCRTVIPEQTEAFEQCRRVWAENRRHFLGKDQLRTEAPRSGISDKASRSSSPEGTP